MKKQLRNIIIAFSVVAVLVVGILILTNLVKPMSSTSSSSDSSSSTPAITVYKTDSTKVTSIQVKSGSSEYTIRQASGVFTIDGLNNVPLNQSTVKDSLSDSTDVTASRLIESKSSNLKQYGLDKPKIVVTVTSSDGTSYVIDVGNATPASDGYYIKLGNSNDVYKSESQAIHDDFSGSVIYYVNTEMTSLDTTKLTEMTSIFFGGSSRPATIVLDEDKSTEAAAASSETAPGYLMVSPRTYALDNDQISTVTTALPAILATSVLSIDVSQKNLTKYGLVNPKYTFGYVFDNQKTTIDVGTPYDDSGTTYLPLKIEGTPVIYSIEESSLPFYNWQMSDMCSTMLFSEYIDDVKSITVKTATDSYTINLTGTSDALVGTYGKEKLVTDDIRLFYQSLAGISFEGAATQPKNGSLYCHVEVDFRNAATPPVKMDFTSIDGQKLFWSYNGTGDFYVLRSQVDTMIQAIQSLTAGKTVVLPE